MITTTARTPINRIICPKNLILSWFHFYRFYEIIFFTIFMRYSNNVRWRMREKCRYVNPFIYKNFSIERYPVCIALRHTFIFFCYWHFIYISYPRFDCSIFFLTYFKRNFSFFFLRKRDEINIFLSCVCTCGLCIIRSIQEKLDFSSFLI